MIYNIFFEISAFCFMLIIFIYHSVHYKDSTMFNKKFRTLLAVGMASDFFDFFTAITISYYKMIPIPVNIVLNALNFVLMAGAGYAYCSYVAYLFGVEKKAKGMRVNKALFAAFCVCSVANMFFGFFFYFDADNGYAHGDYCIIQYAICYYYVIYALWHLILKRKQISKRITYSAGVSAIVILFCVVLQLVFFRSILLYGFGVGLAATIVFFSLETPDYQKLNETMKKLEQARKDADAANEAKSRFLAQMSHEIRTPINAVLGMNEMILRETKEEATLEYAGNAYNAGNALLSIINDILDISKIEAGKLEIMEADYELFSLISDCYHMTAERAKKKGLELRVSCDEMLPSHFKGDMFHIRQIVVNFLTNAIKYTDKGFAELIVSGEKRESGFLLRFTVRDTGIGLKPESIEKLFTNFQRFDLERNQTVEGTGLGLSICKQLAELMGGNVHVESVYGEGSTFICEIPQQMISDAPIGKLDFDVSTEGLDISGKNRFTAPDVRILVVDDVEMNLVVFRSFLKEHKMQIDTAMSGRECLSLLQNNKYDIIFLDHMMPVMDGMETFAKMREQDLAVDTPVVMLTANAISGEKEKYLAAGFSSYLSKPIKSEKLDETLLEWISPEKLVWSEKAEKTEEKSAAVSESADLMDVSLGISYSADNEDAYKEILKSYVKTSGELSEKLRRYCAQRDFSAYVIEVHALKGMSLNIGAKKLSEEAKELELAGKNGDYALIEKRNGALLELYEKVLIEARKYLGKETHKIEGVPSETPEISFDEFSKLIGKIKAACTEYDSSKISTLCREGSAYSCRGTVLKPLLDDIKACAEDFECEDAAKKAEAAFQKLK